jgi:hypothetical protein
MGPERSGDAALSGIRVIEVGAYMAAPFAATRRSHVHG